jgi:hypothetical protein
VKNDRSIDAALAAANPLPDGQLRELPLEAAERELMLALRDEGRPGEAKPASRRWTPHLPRLAFGAVALAALAAAVIAIGLGGYGGAGTPAYAAGLVRLAKASPLVLLERPGWRVESIGEPSRLRGEMRFRKGSGPGAQTAELRWRRDNVDSLPVPSAQRPAAIMIGLSVRALVTVYGSEGGRSRKLVAAWEDHGRLLEFTSFGLDLAEFEHRLDSLRRVGTTSWLDALPKRVTASAHGEASRPLAQPAP